MDAFRQDAEDLPGTIAVRLALAIHEHRLLPGTKLSEDEVGSIYGVSRTLVRAALLQLSHEQLVVLRRNRGAFVTQPTIKEAHEVFEVRALLEPHCARAAAARTTPADTARLQAIIDHEHLARDAGENSIAMRLSGLFHIEVARLADQRTLVEFIAHLVARSSLIFALYGDQEGAPCSKASHHAILHALAYHDADAAEDQMRRHILALVAALNLRNPPAAPQTLREALETSPGLAP